jgi:WhiB family redox-sensing transcriptional regulator
MGRDDWTDQANCKGVDTNLFFAERGGVVDINAAKAVCADCPVRAECLEAGRREEFGVWGGLSRRQRRNMGRKLVLPTHGTNRMSKLCIDGPGQTSCAACRRARAEYKHAHRTAEAS